MVEAEGSSRIEAGAATRTIATRNSDAPSASHAQGINATQFCQYVYSKPGALFSVTACQKPQPPGRRVRGFLIGRAMVWISRTN